MCSSDLAGASNGFGLIARVASLATRSTPVVEGFAFYALGKSIYFRFLDKGNETTFQQSTQIEFSLSER